MRYAPEIAKVVGPDWRPAKSIRAHLNAGRWWVNRWSPAGFYWLMARAEDAGLVEFRDVEMYDPYYHFPYLERQYRTPAK